MCVCDYMCVCTAAFLGFRFAVLLQHSIKGDRTPRRQICIQNKAARRLGHWDRNLPLQPLLSSTLPVHARTLSQTHACTRQHKPWEYACVHLSGVS